MLVPSDHAERLTGALNDAEPKYRRPRDLDFPFRELLNHHHWRRHRRRRGRRRFSSLPDLLRRPLSTMNSTTTAAATPFPRFRNGRQYYDDIHAAIATATATAAIAAALYTCCIVHVCAASTPASLLLTADVPTTIDRSLRPSDDALFADRVCCCI